MLLDVKKAYPEIVKTIRIVRFRHDHLSYEFVAEAFLTDGSVCHIKDYLFMDGTRKYSYHWQDKQGFFIARWDNAPHWPDIDTFPHHLHDSDSSSVTASTVKTLQDVMDTIKKRIENNI